MGLFDRIEAKLASTINGAFARAFKAEVQPVEIGSAIRKAMDDKAAILSADRAIVPNSFEVELSPADHERLSAYEDVLVDELIASAEEHIATQRYRPSGPMQISLHLDDSLETGVFRVRSSSSKDRNVRGYARSGRRPGEVIETHYTGDDPRSRVQHNQVFPREAVATPEGSTAAAGKASAAAAAAARGTVEAAGMRQHEPEPADPRPAPEPAPDQVDLQPDWPEREAQRRRDLEAWGDEPAEPPARPARVEPREEYTADKPSGPQYEEFESRTTPAVPPEMRPDPANRPWIDVAGDAYPLLGAITVIGRDPHADITLDEGGISRRHLEIRTTHDGPHLVIGLRDLGSTNGTFLNGERITSARLADGDRVTLGRISFVIHTRRR